MLQLRELNNNTSHCRLLIGCKVYTGHVFSGEQNWPKVYKWEKLWQKWWHGEMQKNTINLWCREDLMGSKQKYRMWGRKPLKRHMWKTKFICLEPWCVCVCKRETTGGGEKKPLHREVSWPQRVALFCFYWAALIKWKHWFTCLVLLIGFPGACGWLLCETERFVNLLFDPAGLWSCS